MKVEIDPKLYAVSDPPTGRADLHPYLAAKVGQFWLVSGRRVGTSTAAGIYSPEPVVPAPGTWINQQQLIDGQLNDLFRPLVLDSANPCFQSWKRAGHGLVSCL